MLLTHGKLNCRECYEPGRTEARPHALWRMRNDPGAWGGSKPEWLVLGFSKGSTQTDVYANGDFDQVAFAGMRPRLARVLRHFGALSASQSLDDAISDVNGHIGFGSLIRCSVARQTRGGQFVCSGPLIKKSFEEIPHVLAQCSHHYLVGLPSSVKTVLLLGTDSGYIDRCQALIRGLFPINFNEVNEVSVRADGRLWVHVGHPSGANGHFEAWMQGITGSGARKRMLAEHALGIREAAEATPAALPAEACSEKPDYGRTSATIFDRRAKAREQSSSFKKRPDEASFTPREAEIILAQELKRIDKPTKYIAGFRTTRGRHLALERDRKQVFVWIEVFDRKLGGLTVRNLTKPGQPYDAAQNRNSNLAKRAPRLGAGRRAYYLVVEDKTDLKRLVEWYKGQ